MKKRWNIIVLLFALLSNCGVVKSALAQNVPSHVAWLSLIEGETLFSPSGEKKWVKARLNRPLISGDKLRSRPHSQAELQLGHATAFVGSQTDVVLLSLVQFNITSGQFALSIRQMKPSQVYRIDTPHAAFLIQNPGFYKVVVDNNSHATLINVKKGRAQTYGNRISYLLYPGKSYRFTGSKFKPQSIILKDGAFDQWCQNRANRKFSTRYLSGHRIGYEDLDTYGQWVNVKGYGMIWMPGSMNAKPVYAPVVIAQHVPHAVRMVPTNRANPTKVFVHSKNGVKAPGPVPTQTLKQIPVANKPIAVTKPVPMPVAEPVPMPVAEPVPMPVAEPELMPVAEPVLMPTAEPEPMPVMPVAEPEPIPTAEPEPIPTAEPVPMPVAEPVPMAVAELEAMPIAQPEPEN